MNQDRDAVSSAETSVGLGLEGLSHRFGAQTVVRDVSVSVAPGEVVCLLGPSGCGKTTTLRLAAGLEALQAGRVTIAGREVAVPGREVPPERRRVGLMFQDYALFPHLSVRDNVCFGLRSLKPAERRTRADALLARIGLANYGDSFPHVLSGGEQQRVALARALAPEPVVMLFDEPFSGLDVRLRAHVRDETLSILKEHGVATLLVTHDSEEAMFMADRIALMREGRIMQLGTPEELYDHPVDAFAASFFGDVNELDGVVSAGRIETPLGVLASDLPDGAKVSVMIRPEDIDVVAAGDAIDGPVCKVTEVRRLGPVNLVGMACGNGVSRVVARVPAHDVPVPGAKVLIRLDRSRAFVFPANQKT